jgi:hypothetical protein
MSEMSEILERVSVRNISQFFLFDENPIEKDDVSYNERLDSAYKEIINFLKEKYTGDKEFLKMESRINRFARIREDIYMEIGIRCGARLMATLLEKK